MSRVNESAYLSVPNSSLLADAYSPVDYWYWTGELNEAMREADFNSELLLKHRTRSLFFLNKQEQMYDSQLGMLKLILYSDFITLYGAVSV